MNQFSASEYLEVGGYIAEAVISLGGPPRTTDPFAQWGPQEMNELFALIEDKAGGIGLHDSAAMAGRIMKEIDAGGIDLKILRARVEDLRSIFVGEMDRELFLWVPSERAKFYSRNAEDILFTPSR